MSFPLNQAPLGGAMGWKDGTGETRSRLPRTLEPYRWGYAKGYAGGVREGVREGVHEGVPRKETRNRHAYPSAHRHSMSHYGALTWAPVKLRGWGSNPRPAD
jgi:hypothetical protein